MKAQILAALSLFLVACTASQPATITEPATPDAALAGALRSADTLILDSLLPLEHWNVPANFPTLQSQLLALPRLHDYPVLGSLRIHSPAEVRHWTTLLATAFEAREPMVCDFEPRHAVRLWSGRSRIDILMCFQCGDMVVYRDGKPHSHRPVWSSAVRDAMNSALDQHGILRTKPGDSHARMKTRLAAVSRGRVL